jgi:SAM-dependent methyltransferase
MQSEQYKYMFEAEDKHWWYSGNHENFIGILQRKHILKNGIKVLDAGCGTGRWLQILKNTVDIIELGIDNNENAIEYSATRGNLNLMLADINNQIPDSSSFDLITAFDVIYHRDVDDNRVINNFNNHLVNDGHLLLTVPAFNFLQSKHDQVVHTKKRYTRREIRLLLENNGFEIIKITYCVSLLFPIAVIKRLIDKVYHSNEVSHNEIELPNRIVNHILLSIMRFENFCLKYTSFPFGLSVLALARKKNRVG